jgi:outer membrane protein assembly factor BamE (lipoprotein component of BamABCDE complex)
MKSAKKLIVHLLCVILLAAGCATTGTISAIKTGETPKSDILVKFGEPARRVAVSNGERWEYEYVKTGAPAEQKIMKLSIVFKDEVVDEYFIDVYTEKDKRREPAIPPPPIEPPFRRPPPPIW